MHRADGDILVFLIAFGLAGCAHPKASVPASVSAQQEPVSTVTLTQVELQRSVLTSLEIIWPQVLDGPVSGEVSYSLTIDPSGSVTDVQPTMMEFERSNDSVARQVMRWKFKPLVVNGMPVEARVIWNFHADTRAYGPATPLTDAAVRRLASNMAEPHFPEGVTAGTTCSYRVAIDSDGYLIEAIADSCPGPLVIPALQALQASHFNPIIQNGQPRPYRGEIIFRAP